MGHVTHIKYTCLPPACVCGFGLLTTHRKGLAPSTQRWGVHLYLYTQALTHTLTHTHTHTHSTHTGHIHTIIKKHIRTYIRTYKYTYMQIYIHTYIHLIMHECIHTNVCTIIHTFIHMSTPGRGKGMILAHEMSAAWRGHHWAFRLCPEFLGIFCKSTLLRNRAFFRIDQEI